MNGYYIILIYLSSSTIVLAQNNNIFDGGVADGFSEFNYVPSSNNDIFNGGSADGFSENVFQRNNHIFGGGVADGFDEDFFFNQNHIFSGGMNDGFDEVSYEIIVSEVIIKINLQGAFGGTAMNTNLNDLDAFPLLEPYSSSYEVQNAGVTTTQPILTDNDIVDWVLIELRDKTNHIFTAKAALLKADGSIVETDGTSSVRFFNVPQANYYIAVRHRNHLAIMSSDDLLIETK